MINLQNQVIHAVRRTCISVLVRGCGQTFLSLILFAAIFQKKDGSILVKLLSVFAKPAYRAVGLADRKTIQNEEMRVSSVSDTGCIPMD